MVARSASATNRARGGQCGTCYVTLFCDHLCTIPQSPSVRDGGFGHVIVRDCLSVNRGGAPLRGRAVHIVHAHHAARTPPPTRHAPVIAAPCASAAGRADAPTRHNMNNPTARAQSHATRPHVLNPTTPRPSNRRAPLPRRQRARARGRGQRTRRTWRGARRAPSRRCGT